MTTEQQHKMIVELRVHWRTLIPWLIVFLMGAIIVAGGLYLSTKNLVVVSADTKTCIVQNR